MTMKTMGIALSILLATGATLGALRLKQIQRGTANNQVAITKGNNNVLEYHLLSAILEDDLDYDGLHDADSLYVSNDSLYNQRGIGVSLPSGGGGGGSSYWTLQSGAHLTGPIWREGNVGINIVPNYQLDIQSNTTLPSIRMLGNEALSASASIRFEDADDGNYYDMGIIHAVDEYFQIRANGNGSILIDNDGNIGFGTFPASHLRLYINDDFGLALGKKFYFGTSTTQSRLTAPSPTSFAIENGNIELMRIGRIGSSDATMRVPQHSFGGTADNSPAYAFADDIDSGLFKENDNQTGLTAGGVGRLIVGDYGVEIPLLDTDLTPPTTTGTTKMVICDNQGRLSNVDIPTTGSSAWPDLTGVPAGFADNIDNVADADADAQNEWISGINSQFNFTTLGQMIEFSEGTNKKYAQVATMVGATASTAGRVGLVTEPAAGEDDEYLRGDGTWAVPPPSSWATLSGIPADFADGVDNVDDADADDENEWITGINSSFSYGSTGQTIQFTEGTNNKYALVTTMQGATASTAGRVGVVPQPAAGEDDEFLKGNGTWASPGLGVLHDGADSDNSTSTTWEYLDLDDFVTYPYSSSNPPMTISLVGDDSWTVVADGFYEFHMNTGAVNGTGSYVYQLEVDGVIRTEYTRDFYHDNSQDFVAEYIIKLPLDENDVVRVRRRVDVANTPTFSPEYYTWTRLD